MSLKALAAEAEALISALTQDEKDGALQGLRMVFYTSQILGSLPARLTKVLALGFIEIAVKHSAGWKPETLLAQVTKGSPRLGQLLAELEKGRIDDGQRSARLELRSGEEEVRQQGGGAGPGAAAALAGDVIPPAAAAGRTRR